MSTLNIDPDTNLSAIDIDLPLHADTEDSAQVARLVHHILTAVDEAGRHATAPSQADVVQALSIATAVRAAFAEASARTGCDLAPTLLDVRALEPATARQAA